MLHTLREITLKEQVLNGFSRQMGVLSKFLDVLMITAGALNSQIQKAVRILA